MTFKSSYKEQAPSQRNVLSIFFFFSFPGIISKERCVNKTDAEETRLK